MKHIGTFKVWFKISKTCIKWKGLFSVSFSLQLVLGKEFYCFSAIFIDNTVVYQVTNVGCYVHTVCCAIFCKQLASTHAICYRTSISLPLSTCERHSSDIAINITVSKSTRVQFESRFYNICEKLRLGNGDELDFSLRFNYVDILSVHLSPEYRLIKIRVVYFAFI